VVFFAGFAVFFRAAFGIWVGVIAAVVQAFFAFFWLFSPYWPAALVIIALDMVVIYALGTTSGDAEYA
jgi:cytosine/uracil/thiamine/allantoin permease